MPYKNWATTDALQAADLNNMMADPITAIIEPQESTTSATFTDLATVGPALSNVNLVAGQACLVIVECLAGVVVDQAYAAMSFAVSGVESQAASDANSAYCYVTKAVTNGYTMLTWMVPYVAGVTGAHTFTAKYRGNAGNTAYFQHRRIVVKKF